MMKAPLNKRLPARVMVWALLLSHPYSLAAQDTPGKPSEGQPTRRNMREGRGQKQLSDLITELQQKHHARKQLHQEMTRALQQQMAALREHAKVLEGISDEKQLVEELKKHFQLTDAVLNTMVEYSARLEGDRNERGEDQGSQCGMTPPAEKPALEGHTTHPAGE